MLWFSFNHLIPSDKGNVLLLRQESMEDFYPIDPEVSTEGVKLKTIEGDVAFWMVNRMQKLREQFIKPSFIEKYLPILAILAVGMFILILIYLVLKDFGVLADVAGSLERTAAILKESAAQIPSEAPQ